METEPVFCPYCGQDFEVAIDVSAGSHGFTTDCEVCCRPFDIRVVVKNGVIEEVSFEA